MTAATTTLLDDHELSDWLGVYWRNRTTDGVRETWDPVAGFWRNDHELADAWRERKRRRQILGDDMETRRLNEYERYMEGVR